MEYDCQNAQQVAKAHFDSYGHVMNGLCFACKADGKVSKKPAQPSVKWKCFYECADGSAKHCSLSQCAKRKAGTDERLWPISINASTHHWVQRYYGR
jgi:hypothetical protein